MCDYCGYEFGAPYPDSVCINGYLWDADSDDGDGVLTHGGEDACPACNTVTMLEAAKEDTSNGSCGMSMGHPWCDATVWENAIARATAANPDVASAYLATLKPFKIADWPDHQAVIEGRAPWDLTIDIIWNPRAHIDHTRNP